MNELGHKESKGKRQWTLLPFEALREVVDVLTVNAETKYARNNWSLVENGTTKYMDATLRHIDAWLTGERKDPEDGKSHLAHAACDILFALWFELTGKERGAQTEQLQPGCTVQPPHVSPERLPHTKLKSIISVMTPMEISSLMAWDPRGPTALWYQGTKICTEDALEMQQIYVKGKKR